MRPVRCLPRLEEGVQRLETRITLALGEKMGYKKKRNRFRSQAYCFLLGLGLCIGLLRISLGLTIIYCYFRNSRPYSSARCSIKARELLRSYFVVFECNVYVFERSQAEAEGFSHFHLYVCAAFLIEWRKEILSMVDFQVLFLCFVFTSFFLAIYTDKQPCSFH